MKLTILLLFPFFASAQNIGINTIKPTATLEVNGNLKIRAANGSSTDSILVIRNNEILKIAGTPQPTFLSYESNGYYLLFKSNHGIKNPNTAILINGIPFVSAGTWIYNNEYYFSYSNTSGNALNINQAFITPFGEY